jgi:glycosyltransferase involved in cell wall biosynthesis
MHILIIPSWYSTPAEPIRGSFFRDQALALQKAGHRVGFLVPPAKFRSLHGLAEVRHNFRRANTAVTVEEDSGLMIYRMPWWGWWPSLYPWARGALGLRVFDRYCQEQGTPDVLHGQSVLYGGYLAAYIGQHRRIPSVLTEHSTNYLQRLIFPGQGYFVRYTLRHLQRRFAVSPPLAQALQSYAPGYPVEILPNVVDTAFFTPGTAALLERPFGFVVVGGLSRRKGHHILLRAFAEAFSGQPDVIVRIAGEGRYRKKLEALIVELGLQQQVTLLGLQSRQQVRDLLQHSHVLVSASFFENHPVNVIEAMACGKPIVATRSNGPEYFVDDRIGLLVPTGDPAALASALRQMVQDYHQYDLGHIRAACVSQYSEDAFVNRLEEIYQNVIEQSHA